MPAAAVPVITMVPAPVELMFPPANCTPLAATPPEVPPPLPVMLIFPALDATVPSI